MKHYVQEKIELGNTSQLVIQKSIGPDGLHPRQLGELGNIIARMLSIILERPWIRGGSCLLGESKLHICCQEGQEEGGFGELRAAQLHFRPWVDYGTNPPGSHFQAHEEGDWKQPVQLHQGQITHALIAFYNEMSDCDVYLDISEAFGTISGSIVVRHGLHKWKIRWMETDCTAGFKIL